MQLVIDIPAKLYEANMRGLKAGEVWDLRVAVKNGRALPKDFIIEAYKRGYEDGVEAYKTMMEIEEKER